MYNAILPTLLRVDDSKEQLSIICDYLEQYKQEHEVILDALSAENEELKKRIATLENEERITITDVIGSYQFKQALKGE